MTRSRTLALILVPIMLLTSCAGRTPNPIAIYQPGDNSLNCEALQIQMGYCEQQRAALAPHADKTGSNIVLGVLGWFLIVPWFFMDFSDADKVEMNAYGQRYNHLASLYVNKGCGERMPLPLTKEELKKLEKNKSLLNSYDEQIKKDLAAYETASSQEKAEIRNTMQNEASDKKDQLVKLHINGKIDEATFDRQMAELNKEYAITPTRTWLVGTWNIDSSMGQGTATFNADRSFIMDLDPTSADANKGMWEIKGDSIKLEIMTNIQINDRTNVAIKKAKLPILDIQNSSFRSQWDLESDQGQTQEIELQLTLQGTTQ